MMPRSCTLDHLMGPALDSPQRVLRAMARRHDIDRVPLVFRAEPPLMCRLREQLHLASDLEVLRHFGADSIQIAPVFRPEAKRLPDKNGHFTDIFGNRYQSIKNGDLESYSVLQ